MKTFKTDLTTTGSRPDLEITNVRRPGAYVVTKDGIVPDLNDEAMKERETINGKRETEKKKESEKDSTVIENKAKDDKPFADSNIQSDDN